MSPPAAESYLRALLNRPLHIYTTDNRMFVGEFKCTDKDLNIILASTHEYRLPPPPSAADFLSPTISSAPSSSALTAPPAPGKITKPMTPRYVGLIVVPGAHVVKIEVEGEGPWIESGGTSVSGNVSGGKVVEGIEGSEGEGEGEGED